MNYPKYPEKISEEALINPSEFIRWEIYEKKFGIPAPENYLFVYYPYLLNHLLQNYSTRKIPVYHNLTLHIHENTGIVLMPGIGAPQAVVVCEDLIGMGGKNFISIGSAGGLKDYGIYLCEKSLRDEGTSYHYMESSEYAHSDVELTNQLEKKILEKQLPYQRGTSWTIDAPYRETRKEVQYYAEKGITTVEMEASALFALGKFRKVRMASAFSVSDLVNKEKWEPKFSCKNMKSQLKKLAEAGMECLLSLTN